MAPNEPVAGEAGVAQQEGVALADEHSRRFSSRLGRRPRFHRRHRFGARRLARRR